MKKPRLEGQGFFVFRVFSRVRLGPAKADQQG
jgi:hypothetical protein